MTPGFSAIPIISYIEDEEEKLVARIVELVAQYGRYGYRRLTALLNQEGWLVKHKKAERKGDKNEPRPYRIKGRTSTRLSNPIVL